MHAPFAKWLFAQLRKRNLDSVVEKLLEFDAELIAAIGAAVEELRDRRDRRVSGHFHPRRAADIGQTVEVVIGDILEACPTCIPATGSLRIRNISARAPWAGKCS